MPSTPDWNGSLDLLETSDSPDWQFAEKYTCTRTFRGPYATTLSSVPMPGAFGTGDLSGYVVSSSRVSREPGGVGKLQIVYVPWSMTFEGGGPAGALLPPDECGISMDRQDIPLWKHSRYSHLTDMEIEAVNLLIQNFDEYAGKVPPTSTGESRTYIEIVEDEADAEELYTKLLRGFTAYPIWVPLYRWKLHYWACPAATTGGYCESPNGPIPAPETDWIRQADQLDFNGTHWVLERSWMGMPDLDHDIYPAP
jgi:hypothetical protein